MLAHGTTVATNALLQGQGAPVALVTTRGFADVIEIARQARPSLYDIWADRPPPLVPRELRFEVGGRLDAHGREIEPVDAAAVPEIPGDVEAVAVCLLHADLNPAHERLVAEVLRDPRVRRDLLPRGVARVPGVRAHGDDGGQRARCGRSAGTTSGRSRRWPTRCW